jgi:hypothetical protein
VRTQLDKRLKEKDLAPRARFELATLRLTVAALKCRTECDDLLCRCFLSPVTVIRTLAPQLPFVMVSYRGWAQNWAQSKSLLERALASLDSLQIATDRKNLLSGSLMVSQIFSALYNRS